MAITVTSGKIHLPIGPRRILTQSLLHRAMRLDELAPIRRRQESETPDAVAHGDLIDSLLLRFRLHQLLDREAGLGQALFDPRQRQGQRRAPPLETTGEFRHEGTHHRRVGSRHVRDDQDETLGIFFSRLHHLVGPFVGAIAIHPVGSRCGHRRVAGFRSMPAGS